MQTRRKFKMRGGGDWPGILLICCKVFEIVTRFIYKMRNLINILRKFFGSWNSGVICLDPFFIVGLISCLDTNVKKIENSFLFTWKGRGGGGGKSPNKHKTTQIPLIPYRYGFCIHLRSPEDTSWWSKARRLTHRLANNRWFTLKQVIFRHT